ncbi:hypothetical protein KX729_10985 [Rhizobium sp. XQZ8]|uniref:hypothetical protein n=1 Tax=Rhizobium populisoli TaxID=2859785 RepID=UPI001CA488DF|nr:hypothetical protein [Rhizobium populisoli]MBW6421968.1 hypothetical protein [Rhizobium populisoli]
MESKDTSREATRFGSSQPSVAKSSGTGESPSKKSANPSTLQINKARKDRGVESAVKREDRVADAGDAGS